MTKWEYMTVVLQADINIKDVVRHLNEHYPKWKDVPSYHVKAIEAQLDKFGNEGWELIHIEPVNTVGEKGDLGFFYPESRGASCWRRDFFSVFKRPLIEEQEGSHESKK